MVMLQAVTLAGVRYAPGDVADLPGRKAASLVALGKARPAAEGLVTR